jgi:hypothetical protein
MHVVIARLSVYTVAPASYSAHDSGMTFCTFIRYAQSQIIKKKNLTARKPNDLHIITKEQKIHVCFKEKLSQYMSTFMSRADITFKDKKSINHNKVQHT